MTEAFSARLLAWFSISGRHDLPWQHPRTAYRVWISEVMLQQTQVATAIPYFERFIDKFPDIQSLAQAQLDQVLAQWAGLGYYSRARNLHRGAQIAMQEHGGELPKDVAQLNALPGIGRSTAAAILAQAYGQRLAILDGNVKRVLSRHAGIAGDPARSAVQNALWFEAEQRLPQALNADVMADYTQAIMDLGARVCVRQKPRCDACPVREDCIARIEQRTATLPSKKIRRAVPERIISLLLAFDQQHRVLLVQRPERGIWGGLWSLPELDNRPINGSSLHATEFVPTTQDQTLEPQITAALDRAVLEYSELPMIEHRLTHFLLRLRPILVLAGKPRAAKAAQAHGVWVSVAEFPDYGVPAPIRKLILAQQTTIGREAN